MNVENTIEIPDFLVKKDKNSIKTGSMTQLISILKQPEKTIDQPSDI
jgi:hypothetical protein